MVNQTVHRILCRDARHLDDMASESVDLMITSPPYPMIQMWDELFGQLNPAIEARLEKGMGMRAFDLMHIELDRIWEQAFRLIKSGGIACINVGDATRTVDGRFGLYANHVRITDCMGRLGFTALPVVLWRKPTNAPTKFMGSGMYPPGAYVTLEHEYVLIFRKGDRRSFDRQAQIQNRRESAYFWEERNTWFSDVWFDLPGVNQALGRSHSRKRSAAFPFEIPYRLINMFSIKGDTVLDPFAGIGTTLAAAAVAGRNSVGIELDPALVDAAKNTLSDAAASGRAIIENRLRRHLAFVASAIESGQPPKYTNRHYRFPVKTRQEQDLLLDVPVSRSIENEACVRIKYNLDPAAFINQALHGTVRAEADNACKSEARDFRPHKKDRQLKLWDSR